MAKKVLIIGAGVAGLAATIELTRAGVKPLLLEALEVDFHPVSHGQESERLRFLNQRAFNVPHSLP
jgi:2-polyprenyl-6-methoxyphenol hydroxylase-like FAD-dependent oxidoreductase